MHRNPELFPQPDKFRPERFQNKSETEEHNNPYNYIPFSAGE